MQLCMIDAALECADFAMNLQAAKALDLHHGHRRVAPAPLRTTALYDRLTSRGESDFADRIRCAMRFQVGEHPEKRWL